MTQLYQDTIDYWQAKQDQEYVDLHVQVWSGTPYMIDVFTGGTREEYLTRTWDIHQWCLENLGADHYAITGKEGVWQRGGATVDGWTWYGFKTEEMMNRFKEVWQTRK